MALEGAILVVWERVHRLVCVCQALVDLVSARMCLPICVLA